MMQFIKQRGIWLATVVLVLTVTALLQISVSYTVAYGALQRVIPGAAQHSIVMVVLRFGLIGLMAYQWLLGYQRALFRCIILTNGFFTLSLLLQTYALARILSGITEHGVDELLVDVAMIAVMNILIFSIWYWIIDPPGVEEDQGSDEPWEFMFPQRGSNLPNYEAWIPRYADYLFLAFTTSFAFSPTDTLPLSKRAKMLMMLQATISVVTLTGIAGSAINILASHT